MAIWGIVFWHWVYGIGFTELLGSRLLPTFELHEFLRTLSMLIGGVAHQILGLIESTVSYTQQKGT